MSQGITPTNPSDAPGVSVIIPAREDHVSLPGALESIFAQDYPGPIEVLLADGSRSDRTENMLREHYPRVRRLANPKGTIPAGLNLALASCRHDIVARCDAGARFPTGHLSRAVSTLRRTGAANVGGCTRPRAESDFQHALALVMSSPLGAGDARYRLGGPEGPADSVYLGVFRRDALRLIGGWNEALEANEDYELNWRLREQGLVVWFDEALSVWYLPKTGFAVLAGQQLRYGRFKAHMLALHPRSLRARQLAPPLLVAGFAVSASTLLLGGFEPDPATLLAAIGPLLYLAALPCWSASVARGRAATGLVSAVAATLHFAWGAGFLLGLPMALRRRLVGRPTLAASRGEPR